MSNKKPPPEIVAFKTTMRPHTVRAHVEAIVKAHRLELQNEKHTQKAKAARQKGRDTQSRKAQQKYKKIRDAFEMQTAKTKTEAATKAGYEYWEVQYAYRAINKPIPKPTKS